MCVTLLLLDATMVDASDVASGSTWRHGSCHMWEWRVAHVGLEERLNVVTGLEQGNRNELTDS